MSVRCFFPHSNLSQTTVVSAQDKSQRASHEIFSKLISTLSALVHLDCESPKIPFFGGSWYVCCAIRAFRHNPSPFKVKGRITICRFHDSFASKFHVYFVKRTPLFMIILVFPLVRQKLRRKASVGPLPPLKCTVNINSLHFNVLAF